jgi:hypothetical protein
VSGRFWGLAAVAVIVLAAPGGIVDGFATQLIVGGSNALTVKPAEHVAVSHDFNPSLPGLPSFTEP